MQIRVLLLTSVLLTLVSYGALHTFIDAAILARGLLEAKADSRANFSGWSPLMYCKTLMYGLALSGMGTYYMCSLLNNTKDCRGDMVVVSSCRFCESSVCLCPCILKCDEKRLKIG